MLALPGKRADPAEEAEALAALREARNGRRAAVRTAGGRGPAGPPCRAPDGGGADRPVRPPGPAAEAARPGGAAGLAAAGAIAGSAARRHDAQARRRAADRAGRFARTT